MSRLDALIQLPFSAIVTTNYDLSLHKARINKKGWFSPVELGDGSLRGASLQRDFFIARIHGRAELPSSMVVDHLDYKELAQDTDYLDFLLHILKIRPCLFLGFSFDDTAVNSVLDLYEKRCGPHYPSLHLALVPTDSPSLTARLHKVNIQVLTYDPGEGHTILWKAIRLAFTSNSGEVSSSPISSLASGLSSPVHNYMAFAYAQMRSTEQREPVVASIRDGIVLTTIAESSSVGVTKDEVIAAVKTALSLSPSEAASLVDQSLERLKLLDQVVAKGSRLKARHAQSDDLDSDLSKLAAGVLARLRVRDPVKPSRSSRRTIKRVLERAFLARAWDLAAHFAGSGTGVGADIAGIIGDLLQQEGTGGLPPSAAKMAIVDLLKAPGDHETHALSRIGRAAFGLQLVLSSPRQALFRKYSLPQRIYLDANVVMPAITNGHPLRSIYVDCLRRLEQANKMMGQALCVGVGYQFLNEVVSHRQLAINIVKEIGLEDPVKLRIELAPRREPELPLVRLGFAPASLPADLLASSIDRRCTNRKRADPTPLAAADLDLLHAAAAERGARLELITEAPRRARLADCIGAADRLRLLSPAMLRDLAGELRWTVEEVERTRDGIDVRALELRAGELASLRLMLRAPAMAFLRTIGGGDRIRRLAQGNIADSPVLGVVACEGGSGVEPFFRGGRAIERLWLRASERGLSLAPMTTLLFLMRLAERTPSPLSADERREALKLKRAFDEIVPMPPGALPVFLFRLGRAQPPAARSIRKHLDDLLIVRT